MRIMKKSLISTVMALFLIMLACTSAFAASNNTYLTFPAYDTSASKPAQAIISDDKVAVGFRFEGDCPLVYAIAIEERDSSGNYVPGYSYCYVETNQTTIKADYAAGGKTFYVPNTGMVKGHIYRVQVAAAYNGMAVGTQSTGFMKY